jgi:hypothetical protein
VRLEQAAAAKRPADKKTALQPAKKAKVQEGPKPLASAPAGVGASGDSPRPWCWKTLGQGPAEFWHQQWLLRAGHCIAECRAWLASCCLVIVVKVGRGCVRFDASSVDACRFSTEEATYEAELKSYLKKHGATKLGVLGSQVKKPAGVPKMKKFLEERKAVFKLDVQSQTVSLK